MRKQKELKNSSATQSKTSTNFTSSALQEDLNNDRVDHKYTPSAVDLPPSAQ